MLRDTRLSRLYIRHSAVCVRVCAECCECGASGWEGKVEMESCAVTTKRFCRGALSILPLLPSLFSSSTLKARN